MRHRLIALGLVSVLAVTACSKPSNVDLVLPSGSTVPGASGAPATPGSTPTATTNPDAIAIDRSTLTAPNTPNATVAPGSAGSLPNAANNPAASVPGNPTTTAAGSPGKAASPTPGNTGNPSGATPGASPGASPVTLAPSSSIDFLYPSTAGLATSWNKARTTISGSPFAAFDATKATNGLMSNGAQGFADKTAVPGGVLGGTVEANGQVSSVLIIIPGSTDMQAAMQTVWALLDGTRAEVPIFEGMQRFNTFAANGIPAEGTQAWIDSTGPNYSVALTVVPGSIIGATTSAIEVAVVPVKDQGNALATAQPLRVEVLQLVK